MAGRGTTSKPLPKSSRNVMASRREPTGSLDFFPTPPWATRALCQHVLDGQPLDGLTCWEPAAGRGHMAEVLREYFKSVHASDVFDYRCGYDVGSFIGAGLDVATCPFRPDFIITNPPFNEAEAFVQRALGDAAIGVAMLVRTAWLESRGRYESLFAVTPPAEVALFVEREMHPQSMPPDNLVADARCELDAHRQLSRVLRRLNKANRRAASKAATAARPGSAGQRE